MCNCTAFENWKSDISNKLQSEFFAQKFINVGFDSFEMIENIS